MKVRRVGSTGVDLFLPLNRPVVSLLRRLPAFLVFVPLLSGQADRKQAALGAQMAAEIRRETTPLDCPIALQFINELGEKLAPQLSGERPDYDFTLILDEIGGPEREPYSLPGATSSFPQA